MPNLNFLHKTIIMLAAIMPGMAMAQQVNISVVNHSDEQRQEVIEISADNVYKKLGVKPNTPLIVKNAFDLEEIYQITHDGKLLIEATVRPNGTAKYTISQGKPQAMKSYVQGKLYKERLDDISWENDRAGYRFYGPALQKQGQKGYGIDLWMKNTPELSLDTLYNMEYRMERMSRELSRQGRKEEARRMEREQTYHIDHGIGVDCYNVGPTLGCGAPAMLDGDKLVYPWCYTSYKILDNGPLRFTIETTYDGKDYHSDSSRSFDNVVEHRLTSLDKGASFNKMTVWYDNIKKPINVSAGFVVHAADTTGVVLDNDYIAYADPTDQPQRHNYQIYVAALFPYALHKSASQPKFAKFGDVKTRRLLYPAFQGGNAGNAIGELKDYRSGSRFTYFFGATWSKTDVRNMKEWRQRIATTLSAIYNPLEIKY